MRLISDHDRNLIFTGAGEICIGIGLSRNFYGRSKYGHCFRLRLFFNSLVLALNSAFFAVFVRRALFDCLFFCSHFCRCLVRVFCRIRRLRFVGDVFRCCSCVACGVISAIVLRAACVFRLRFVSRIRLRCSLFHHSLFCCIFRSQDSEGRHVKCHCERKGHGEPSH